MPTSTVTSKGQVTIPKAIRDRLGLEEGDKLEFTLDDRERIVARPRRAAGRVEGILRQYARAEPVTIEEMNRAVRERARRKANPRAR